MHGHPLLINATLTKCMQQCMLCCTALLCMPVDLYLDFDGLTALPRGNGKLETTDLTNDTMHTESKHMHAPLNDDTGLYLFSDPKEEERRRMKSMHNVCSLIYC
jgi:hypothetical protein